MVCVYCHSKTKVVNSRPGRHKIQTWRRRACLNCASLFTSLEKPLLENSVAVISLNGTFEAFSRDKLLISLHESLKHRHKALEEATALTETIIASLLKQSGKGALNMADIKQAAAATLRRFDHPAFVHYEAFHASGK